MQGILHNSKERFLRLSQVSAGIRDAISGVFGDRFLWIVAEVSDLSVRKGHCYLSLVEKLPDSPAPVCELKGIIWANKFERISRIFMEGTGTELTAGTRILFQASVRYDIKWGLNLVVEDVEPAYTVGIIKKERDQTVARLKAEGIFTNNKKLAFPLVPLRVAVISARDSRGFEDFQNKLLYNSYGYRFSVELFTSLLQGDRAPVEMVNRLIAIFNRKNEFDLVVIVRGGGGSIDLNCFNDYKLARAVARFPLPVLTGIGHTTNISVVDEVAFADRITPTDAADFIVERTRAFEELLAGFAERIQSAFIDVTVDEQSKLQHLANGIKMLTGQCVDNAKSQLSNYCIRFRNESTGLLKDSRTGLLLQSQQLGRAVTDSIHIAASGMNERESSLKRGSLGIVSMASMRLAQFDSGIRLLDPVNVLKRGYSITRVNGKALRNASGIAPGTLLKTTLYEGTIESEVKGNR